MAELRVTLVRSTIGAKPKHRGTIRALGLRRLNHSVILPDRPEIRGMLARVPHLVRVEDAEASREPAPHVATRPKDHSPTEASGEESS